mmetsp:Transcript_5250/g.14219  ORF Transcript_5250/g.14219 Transcript_5250/m.14219 type:complete len:221 (+) Transcript_5250:66-728(+)
MYAPACQQPGVPLPSGEEIVSYAASWPHFYFLTLCSRPRWGPELFDALEQSHARERFQAWIVLKMLLFITIELATFLWGFLSSLGLATLQLPIVAMNFSITVFLMHLSWYFVVKKEGGCGRDGYVYVAAWLALEPLALCVLSALVADFAGWLRLLLYAPNFFLAAACFRLFTAPATPVRTMVDKVAGAMEQGLAGVRAVVEPCCPCCETAATRQHEIAVR